MSDQAQANGRWWEAYLVRYLVGTPIALFCLVAICDATLRGYPPYDGYVIQVQRFLTDAKLVFDTALVVSVTIVALAYCYVASAPITTFHATRMYRSSWFNRTSRYVWLAVWVALTLWICFGSSPNFFLWIIAAPAIWTVFVQILCIMRLHADEPINGERAPNGIYLWFCKLLTRKEAEQNLGTESANFVTFYESLVDKRSGEHGVGMRESYTHLREHSNAIFIVLLEVSLAAMIVCLVGAFGGTPKHKLLIVVAVLFVWLIPAVFLWAQANRLERSLISYKPE